MSEQQTGFEEAVQVGTASASHIKSLKTISNFCKNCKRRCHWRASWSRYWCRTFKPTHGNKNNCHNHWNPYAADFIYPHAARAYFRSTDQ